MKPLISLHHPLRLLRGLFSKPLDIRRTDSTLNRKRDHTTRRRILMRLGGVMKGPR